MAEEQYNQPIMREEDISVMLASIVSDRMPEHVGEIVHETMDESARETIEANLSLLTLLNGHAGARLRDAALRYQSEEAIHLRELLEWSREIDPRDVRFGTIVKTSLPGLLRDAGDAYAVIERLEFKERHPDAAPEHYEDMLAHTASRACGSEHALKWKDIRDRLFGANKEQCMRALLTHVGSIPTEIVTRNKFGAVDPHDVIECIDILKKLEPTEIGAQAQYERARLLNHFVARGAADKARIKNQRPIDLDANGIRVRLRGLHAHIPYGLINDDLMRELKFGNWLTNAHEKIEIELRRAEENSDANVRNELRERQERDMMAAWGNGATIESMASECIRNPDALARRIMRDELMMPDNLIERLRRDAEGIYALTRIAESCGAHIADERMTRKTSLFASYELGEEVGRSYHMRKHILHDPRYFNTTKIMRHILAHEPPHGVQLFKSQYKKSATGATHAFLAIAHKGKIARVLLDESRHIHGRQHIYRTLPKLSRKMYEQAEYQLRTFHYVSDAIDTIESLLEQKPKNYEKRLRALREVVAHFALTNATAHLPRIEAFGEPSDALLEDQEELFIGLLRDMQEHYRTFLQSSAAQSDIFLEKGQPEVRVNDREFSEDDIDDVKRNVAPDGYDEYLFAQQPACRTVELTYREDDPSRTVPYHIEEACLDALRVNRNRPLINIVGGCRKQDAMSEYAYADVVARIAHEHQANVAIPGTQSGVGIAFSRVAVAYRQTMADVPRAKQAHFFAVTPGANAYYAGNPFAHMAPQNERFAIAPVDSLLTPFAAQWEKSGAERVDSDYTHHVRYMEAVYARVAGEEPHIMVVGGGGLFSIVEMTHALAANAQVILLKETGRCASVCAAMLNHIDMLPDDEDMFYNWMIPILEELPRDIREEFERKDFGRDDPAENENAQSFRTLLFQSAHALGEFRDRIHVSSVDDIERDMEGLLAVGK